MRIWLLIALAMFCASCVTTPKPKRADWLCAADVNRDGNCVIIPCEDIGKICDKGDYRLLKYYPTKNAYVYSTNPKTDITRCIKDVKFREELDRLTRIQTDPRVSREEADKATAEIERLIAERLKN
ncbi:MAG: hypothetical protein ABIJ57_02585 [Pseudomonadota bacterium]